MKTFTIHRSYLQLRLQLRLHFALRCGMRRSIGALCCLAALNACAPSPPTPVLAEQRFQKLTADGQAIGLQEGPWRCVRDQQTGLVWEVKQANEGEQFNLSSYSWWNNGKGSAKGGSCGVDKPGMPFMAYVACDTQDLLDFLNQTKLCGFKDWRLPSSAELRSILFAHRYPGETHLPFSVLPRITYGPYWTADSRDQPSGMPQALAIHVGTAQEGWLSSQRVAYALAVRGQPLAASAKP